MRAASLAVFQFSCLQLLTDLETWQGSKTEGFWESAISKQRIQCNTLNDLKREDPLSKSWHPWPVINLEKSNLVLQNSGWKNYTAAICLDPERRAGHTMCLCRLLGNSMTYIRIKYVESQDCAKSIKAGDIFLILMCGIQATMTLSKFIWSIS